MGKDQESIHEVDDIAHMLKHAKEQGLEVEVVWSFANELLAGETDIRIAVSEALLEWDI